MVFTAKDKKHELASIIVMGLFFIIVYGLAISLVQPFVAS